MFKEPWLCAGGVSSSCSSEKGLAHVPATETAKTKAWRQNVRAGQCRALGRVGDRECQLTRRAGRRIPM